MNEIYLQILDELMKFSEQGAEPEEVSARFRELRTTHPGAALDVVWDREPYQGRPHYDALIGVEGRGTISVSFCPDHGLPWPLRGAQRWSEYELLRVNQTLMRVDEAIDFIDFIWNEEALLKRLIDSCLVRETLEKDPIDVSDDEIQSALDQFRRERGLESQEKMLAWMKSNGLDQVRLERHLEWETTKSKLRKKIAENRVEDYFATKKSSFEVASVVELVVPEREAARIAEELAAGADLLKIAAYYRTGRFIKLVKRAIDPQLATQLFTKAGSIVGPLQGRIYRVLDLHPAVLDAPTRELIEQELFEDWMASRRANARISWNWGMNPERDVDERVRPYR